MNKDYRNLKNNIALLKETQFKLSRGGIKTSSFESEVLLRHFGQVNRVDFFTGAKTVSLTARRRIQKATEARLSGRPLDYILKKSCFYGLTFFVSKDVLIPRPETEILVEETLLILNQKISKKARVLDIGTGSGCVAVSLTIYRPDCRMTALDVCPKALDGARRNIRFHGLDKKIKLVSSDLFAAFGDSRKAYWDVIVSNPPYVALSEIKDSLRQEPLLALNGGRSGLDALMAILEKGPHYLKSGGWLLMEIGYGQSKRLAAILRAADSFKNFYFVKDYLRVERVLVAQKK